MVNLLVWQEAEISYSRSAEYWCGWAAVYSLAKALGCTVEDLIEK